VRMTSELIKVFPKQSGSFQIEPDASSGSYFLAAHELLSALQSPETLEYSQEFGMEVTTIYTNTIAVAHWPSSGWQVDQAFGRILTRTTPLSCGLLGIKEHEAADMAKAVGGPSEISRARDLGDSIMTAVVLAPFSSAPIHFTDLGRLRLQECERVSALRTELTKCGAKVVEEGDTLTVYPSSLHGAEIETYNDHRIAMCFAILGLKVAGIKLKNPSCVKKTFPSFFQKLGAQPPEGLGARLLDGQSGRPLGHADLFAQ
jgi:3-phosphoshikimate 1-carboxyvinyltransferase